VFCCCAIGKFRRIVLSLFPRFIPVSEIPRFIPFSSAAFYPLFRTISQLTGIPCFIPTLTTTLNGVILDENLGWHDHIGNISKKVKRGISVLRKIRDSIYLLRHYRKFTMPLHVQPHFDYCWDNYNKGLRDKLQRLQNRVGRIIMHSGYEIRSAKALF
jgi:hypothetical protein